MTERGPRVLAEGITEERTRLLADLQRELAADRTGVRPVVR